MKLLRRLIAPAALAAPAVHLAIGVAAAGPRVIADYRPDARALLAVAGIELVALLLIGWPSALAVARLRLPLAAAALLLVAVGALAAGALSTLFFGGLRGASLSAVLGALTAAIWTAFNTDILSRHRRSGGQNA